MKKVAKSLVALLIVMSLLAGCSSSSDSTKIIEIDELFDKGEYETAFTMANEYVEEYPEHYIGWRLLGWINLKLDDSETAIENFNKAIELNENADNAYVGLGATYRLLGDDEKARESYAKALEIEENNPEALGSIMVLELYEGDFENSIKHGEKAWELCEQSNAIIAANLTIVYHYAGEVEKRDEFLQHAKDLGYSSLDVIEQIVSGEFELEIGNKDE